MKPFFWLAVATFLGCIYSLVLAQYYGDHPWWWLSLAFLCLVSVVLAVFYGRQNSPASRAEAIIAGTISRFLASLVLLTVVYLLRKGGFLAFFLHFIGQWCLFTLAEIAYLPASHTKRNHEVH